MKLLNDISFDLINQYVNDRLITCRKHPIYDLYILNYTPECQFSRKWDDFTLQCRGLIIDQNGKVIARPFPKFFNYEEHNSPNVPELKPTRNFIVFDKLDGSLGILYPTPDGPRIATRGSFESPQATKANEILARMELPRWFFDPDYTYLFEIIYPENRIVINYGDEEKLVLLGIINTKTGGEKDITTCGFQWPHIAEYYPSVRYFFKNAILELPQDNKEGVVVLFENGQRVKIKFAEYIKLHKLISGLNKYRVWECLSSGVDIMDLVRDLPDEYYKQAMEWKDELEKVYNTIHANSIRYMIDKPNTDNRKELAEYFKKFSHPNILFLMLDGKNVDQAIWKILKPKAGNGTNIGE